MMSVPISSSFIESIKARIARDKAAMASCEAGLAYLDKHIDELSGDMRASALSWLGEQAKAGRLSQGEIHRFLLGKADSKPEEYPDAPEKGDDDTPAQPPKSKKAKPKADDEQDVAEEPVKGHASEDDVLAMEIKAGYTGNHANVAKQILFAGRHRRGEAGLTPPASTGDPYWDEVNATAAAIVAAGRRRRGEES